MKTKILLIFTFTFSTFVFSQEVLSPNDEDNYNGVATEEMRDVYKKNKHQTKKTQEYPHLRQADVMWSRKIWREIDLRQKINHPFYYPMNNGKQTDVTDDRKSLIDVIFHAATEGDDDGNTLRVYGDAINDDEFRKRLSIEEFKQLMEPTTIETQLDPEALKRGEEILIEVPTTTSFDRNSVLKWRVKEQWFFDKQRSVMDVRILGLAPMAEDKDKDGRKIAGQFKELFWVYFPEARNYLINAEVFNLVKNDAERRTYDDIFMKRMFSSTIVKESTVYDRNVSDFMVGLDALLEAERIKEELFNFEHDLWEY